MFLLICEIFIVSSKVKESKFDLKLNSDQKKYAKTLKNIQITVLFSIFQMLFWLQISSFINLLHEIYRSWFDKMWVKTPKQYINQFLPRVGVYWRNPDRSIAKLKKKYKTYRKRICQMRICCYSSFLKYVKSY